MTRAVRRTGWNAILGMHDEAERFGPSAGAERWDYASSAPVMAGCASDGRVSHEGGATIVR